MKVKKRTRFSKSVQFLAALMMAVMILSSLPFGAQAGFGGVYGLEADSLEAAMDEIVAYYEARGGQLEDWEEILNLRGAGVDLRDGSWTLPDWDSETFPVDGTAGYYGSRILALVAMEKNPEDFFDRNLIDELLAMQQEDGSFLVGTDTNINSQIYAMHALDVAGADYRVQEALEWLTGQINEDGGIGWGVDSPSDVDTTGWLVRLLAGHEAGEGVGETLSTAKAYLLEKQLESGGFASAYSGENANSTANGLLGLRATGADVEAQAALSRLYDFESGTSGFYRYLLEDAAGSTFATKQVLGAFAELHHGRTVFAALSYGWDTLDFTLRVEGAEETLLDEDFGYQTLSDEDSTVESVVAWALDEKGIDYVNAGGYFSQIGGEAAGSFGGFDGWLYRVNGEAQDSGIASTLVVEGDDILFYYGEMAPGTLYPNISTSPGVVYDGEEITFGVTTTYDIYDDDWSYVETTTAAVSGAVITLREEGTTGILEVLATDASGQAATRLDDGSYEYRVTKDVAGEAPRLVRTEWLPLVVRTKAGPGGSTPVGRTDVDVAVIDASRRVLFGPEAVRLYATDEFGETAMGALDATGLSWEFQGHGFIYKINGVANEGMLGWKYAVNGVVPGVSSLDFDVDAGDRVLWWYATEAADEAAPDWPESREDSVSPVAEILEPEERIEGMKAYVESLDGERTVIGSDRRMSEEAARDLDLFLKGHTVDLEVAYDGTETLLDDGEVALLVVEGALEKEARLTVKELKESEGPAGFGIRFRSAVYDFGPDGAQFETPVVIILKLPVGDDLDPETMAPAYYDETQERWVTIPYVLDLETGQVIFEVDHFTAFALMVAPERRVFQDLDDSYDWAREAVEVLGGSGIVSGTGQGFEPGRYITRAEFVKMLLGALALEPKAANPNPFRDVATSDWAYPYLATAHAEGLLAGYPDGSLRPLEAISRFEIATLLARIDTCKEVGRMAAAFSDGMDTPVWAEEGVAHVQTHGLMKGYEDGTFRGGRRLTRAEAAVIIYRYLSLED